MSEKKVSLYKMSDNLAGLLSMDIDDPEMQEAFDETLKMLEGSFNEKVESIVHVIKSVEAEVEKADSEIKRIQDVKRVQSNKVERLKNYIKDQMMNCGFDKAGTVTYPVRLKKRPDMLIVDEESLEDKYFSEIVTRKPDKRTIRELLKSGELVVGAKLEENKDKTLIIG